MTPSSRRRDRGARGKRATSPAADRPRHHREGDPRSPGERSQRSRLRRPSGASRKRRGRRPRTERQPPRALGPTACRSGCEGDRAGGRALAVVLALTIGVFDLTLSPDRYALLLLAPALVIRRGPRYLLDFVPFVALIVVYAECRGLAHLARPDPIASPPRPGALAVRRQRPCERPAGLALGRVRALVRHDTARHLANSSVRAADPSARALDRQGTLLSLRLHLSSCSRSRPR